MKRAFNCLILLLCISALLPAGKDEKVTPFRPAPAASYQTRQTVAKVTIAAVPYESDAQTKDAFGKVNPNEYGVLPILVIVENNSAATLRLEGMKMEYQTRSGSGLRPTPPEDVPYVVPPKKPSVSSIPSPLPSLGRGKKKNPLADWQIEGRAFRAQMILPGESAFGFVYFQTRHQRGSTLYVSGIRDASTGKELFYFDVPLTANPAQ
jgi:hypothetical protein